MRWFKYVWIVIVGILYILWTAVSIEELITRCKTQDEKHDFLDAFFYVFEWGDFFAVWFIVNTLIITIGSFIVWIINITK